MSKRCVRVAVAATILIASALASTAVAADASASPAGKAFVCKYVGTPGDGERLQADQNPIDVSINSIKDYAGVGSYFGDAQGRSYVLAEDVGQAEPNVSQCPGSDPSPSPSVTPNPTPTVTVTPSSTPSETVTPSPTETTPPAPIVITVAAPVFHQAHCTGVNLVNATVTIPDDARVFYSIDFVPGESGTYLIDSPGLHTVDVVARDGYQLTGTVSWTFTTVVPTCKPAPCHVLSNGHLVTTRYCPRPSFHRPSVVPPTVHTAPSLRPVASVQPQLANTGAPIWGLIGIAALCLTAGLTLIVRTGRKR